MLLNSLDLLVTLFVYNIKVADTEQIYVYICIHAIAQHIYIYMYVWYTIYIT